jgi:hypothetical protein
MQIRIQIWLDFDMKNLLYVGNICHKHTYVGTTTIEKLEI